MPIRKDIFEIKSPKFEQGLTLQLKSLRNARNVRMWLAPSGILSVTKPFYVSKAEALKFVDDNSEWIIGQLASFKRPETLGEWLERNPVYSKSGPMKVWLRPRGSEFFVSDMERAEVVFSYAGEISLRKVFVKFSREYSEKLAFELSHESGLAFSGVSVRNQSSRWGSRSTSGLISLNWRLPLLPYELQKYIVCHELCHAAFMDHSQSFWIFLNRLCPGAKRLDARLSKEGEKIFKLARD